MPSAPTTRRSSIDHRLMPSLSARAGLLAARGDWMGALGDLDMALTSRPDDPHLRLRRGELLLRQGDWLRGLADHEARLEIAGERYAPDLPRWQGEPLAGRLLIYPEQADIESDTAMRDTLMLARGVDAVVQCAPRLAEWFDMPTIRRGDVPRRLRRGSAAAQPAASPGLDAGLPAATRRGATGGRALVTHRLVRPQRAAGRSHRRARSRAGRDLRTGCRRRPRADAPCGAPRHPDLAVAGPFRRLVVGTADRSIAVVSDAWKCCAPTRRKGWRSGFERYEVCAATLRKRSNPRPRKRPPMAPTAANCGHTTSKPAPR